MLNVNVASEPGAACTGKLNWFTPHVKLSTGFCEPRKQVVRTNDSIIRGGWLGMLGNGFEKADDDSLRRGDFLYRFENRFV